MTFNEKLKMIREEKEMSLSEFADFLGTSKQVLSRYERGENTPKITTVMHYAEKLGVSLEFFLNDDCVERNQKEETPIEEEQNLLALYRSLSKDKKALVFNMIRVAVGSND